MNKKTHLDYIKSKGKFVINCNKVIFSPEEIKLLETYGYWFEGLAKGILQPFNEEQKQFVESALMHQKPVTIFEKIWFKYSKRKEIEEKAGQSLYLVPSLGSDTFYNRDMAKNLKSTMFKVTRENHKK